MPCGAPYDESHHHQRDTEVNEMEWTPEAIDAEIAYRRGDMLARRHLVEAERTAQPRWWQRLRTHRSQHDVDDGNGAHRAA
jgi:hypothetical protein